MTRRSRTRSCDYTPATYCRNYMSEDDTFMKSNCLRRVHFDDELVNYRNTNEGVVQNKSFCKRPLSVHEITAKLKHSYQNISHGLEVLSKLYHDLKQAKIRLGCNRAVCERSTYAEINRLMNEVESLQHALQKAGRRKRKYLEELSRLQTLIHDDRQKMERWAALSRDSNRKLQSKIDESSKKTRDQQILIEKLKHDNTSLWKILQEIQQHLREENLALSSHCTAENSRAISSMIDAPKQLPQIPNQANNSCHIEGTIYPVSDEGSSELSNMDRPCSGGSSTTSSQDQYLCEKLQRLLEQSENVQRLICNVGSTKVADKDSKCKGKRDEKNASSGMSDIIRRCEELERKVEDCSTKDLRNKIMFHLHEVDGDSNSTDSLYKEEYPCSKVVCNQKWETENHKEVRSELLACLDKIISLERNFTDAQNETKCLRQLIKETKDENEMYKQQVRELNTSLENQKAQYMELEEKFERVQKDTESCSMLKSSLDEKTIELEKLKIEMNIALQAMEGIRQNTRDDGGYINNELSVLQTLIADMESQMRFVQEQNLGLRVDIESKQHFISEVETENDTLIKQLKLREDENMLLRSKLEHLELSTDLQKDAQIRKLESELADTLADIETAAKIASAYQVPDVKSERREKEQEKLISTLLDDNNKYLELISHKDGIIDELRADLSKMTQIVEERLARMEVMDEKGRREELASKQESDITQELDIIKRMLDASHSDIADKVIDLHKELKKLQNENSSLKRHLQQHNEEFNETSSELKHQNELLKEENCTLRDTLNRPYPGIVENILSHSREIKDLKEENELLRLSLNNDRKSLVDSNLRKRTKIKELEERVDELQQDSGVMLSLQRKRSESQGSHERSMSSPERERDQTTKISKTNQKEKKKENDFLEEMMKQNKVIERLQANNDRLRARLAEAKEKQQSLKSENEKMKREEQANESLQNELLSLRTAVKSLAETNERKDEEGNKIKELEDEIRRLKQGDGVSLPGSPNRSRLHLDGLHDEKRNVKKIITENQNLKFDLERAQQDVRRLAELADQKQKDVSAEQVRQTRMKKLEEKVKRLEDEKTLLRDNMKDMELTNENAENEIRYLKKNLDDCSKTKADDVEEINKLRSFIKDLHVQRESQTRNDEDMRALNETMDGIRSQLREMQEINRTIEAEKDRLSDELKTLKKHNKVNEEKQISEAQEEKEKLQAELAKSDVKLHEARLQNRELEDMCTKLTEEMEKIREGISETHFADWLEKDVDRRLALLSPESHRSEVTFDGKRDHMRVIRKLQIENQLIRAKMSSLADEAVATTKIIADMERGHGHLTGTLRCHLILQKPATGKLLDSSLQQYHSDYQILEKNFKSLEDRYDKGKNFSDRRNYAWDLFGNASATIANIQTILDEGLVRVEEDLERDFTDNEFEEKDYRSRLWILRRRLSDVENRHRELQLRAEELNLRLDAKTTEFEVTQDELKDTTRDLESRENSLQKLKFDLRRLANENNKLKDLIYSLKNNQDKTVGAVILENEGLQQAINNQDHQMKTIESDLDEILSKLDEKDKSINGLKRMRDNAEKECEAMKNRIAYLEKRLKEVTAQRDKLKTEADNRAGYMGSCHDDHGTIHMLRDDLKRISKENADLKQDIVLKQRQMYDMSKDLHKLNMQQNLDSSFSKQDRKSSGRTRDEIGIKMIQDLAELKAQKFLLETKLKDLERHKNEKLDNSAEQFFEKAFKAKLIEKEKEIEKLKRDKSSAKPGKSLNASRDDTLSDVNTSLDSVSDPKSTRDIKRQNIQLKSENELLQGVINKKNLNEQVQFEKQRQELERKVQQQQAEVENLTSDVESKRKKIKSLIKAIEGLKEGNLDKKTKQQLTDLLNAARQDEIKMLTDKLDQKEKEIENWRSKARDYERRHHPTSLTSSDDDKFQNVYLHPVEPSASAPTPHDGFLDRNTPQFQNNSPLGTPKSNKSDSGFVQAAKAPYAGEPYAISKDLIDLTDAPVYEVLLPYEKMSESLIPRPIHKPSNVETAAKKTVKKPVSNNHSKIPVTPSKRKYLPSPHQYEIPSDASASGSGGAVVDGKGSKSNKKVTDFESHINRLNDELDIYRMKLRLTEHDNLQSLDQNGLADVIEYQIQARISDETVHLRQHMDELKSFNDSLCNKLKDLENKKFFMESKANTSGELGLQDKLDLTTEENNTLRDLLDTQTQNVRSQEAVIRTLKTDITEHRAREKQRDNYELLSQTLKERKTELKNLKKQMKENEKSLQKEKRKWKHDVKVLKARVKGEENLTRKISEQLTTIENLNLTIDQLRNKIDSESDTAIKTVDGLQKSLTDGNFQYQKLKDQYDDMALRLKNNEEEILALHENLQAKDTEFEIVLKDAESSLEDTKEKLAERKRENEDLKKCILEQDNILHEMKSLLEEKNGSSAHAQDNAAEQEEKYYKLLKEYDYEKTRFRDVKESLKDALLKKSQQLETMQKDFEAYKITAAEKEKELKQEVADLKLLIEEESVSTNSELTLTKTEISSLQDELSRSLKSYAELTEENSKLTSRNKTLSEANDLLEDELSSLRSTEVARGRSGVDGRPDSADEQEDFEKDNDLEIEYEILKGCHDELEAEAEALRKTISEFERKEKEGDEQLTQAKDDLKQTKGDLEQTKGDLVRTKNDLERTLEFLRELSSKSDAIETEKNDMRIEKDEKISLLEEKIKQLEDIGSQDKVDEYKQLLERSEKRNEKSQDMIGQLEDVTDQLESEIKQKDQLIGQLENQLKDEENESTSLFEENARLRLLMEELKRQQNADLSKSEHNIKKLTKQLMSSRQDSLSKDIIIKSLEHSLNDWINKAAKQTERMGELEEKLVVCDVDRNVSMDDSHIENHVSVLKSDIDRKDKLITTLKNEIEAKDQQYVTVMASLNKRRQESKSNLAMQARLHNELESKEDLIRNLKFQLKSSECNLTEDSDDSYRVTDVSMDERLDGPNQIETDLDNQDNYQMIQDQRESLSIMAEQLQAKRKRNLSLTREVAGCHKKYLDLNKDKNRLETENENLKIELEEAKEKLQELREFVHGSPNTSFNDENVSTNLKKKLFTAYKEIREKKVEISAFRMTIEAKTLEVESLEKELHSLRSNYFSLASKIKDEPTKLFEYNHSKDIRVLLQEIREKEENEQELQHQNTELRKLLVENSKRCDWLQNELSKMAGKLKRVEHEMIIDDKSLKERFFSEYSEVFDVTPLTGDSLTGVSEDQTLTPKILLRDDIGNETFLLDGFEEGENETFNVGDESVGRARNEAPISPQKSSDNPNMIQEFLEQLKLLKEKNIFTEKNNENIMQKVKMELSDLSEQLSIKNDDDIQQRNNDSNIDDNVLEQMKEKLLRSQHENTILKNRLALQKSHHDIEMEHLQTSLQQVKDEHVQSLKSDLETNMKEKIANQMKIRTMEQTIAENEKKISELLKGSQQFKEYMV